MQGIDLWKKEKKESVMALYHGSRIAVIGETGYIRSLMKAEEGPLTLIFVNYKKYGKGFLMMRVVIEQCRQNSGWERRNDRL